MSEVGACGAALVLTWSLDPGSWSLSPPPPAGTHCLSLERFGRRSERWEPPPAWVPRHILASGEVGPRPGLPSHSRAACSPAGPAGVTEPEACRDRSVPQHCLVPSHEEGATGLSTRRVCVQSSALLALSPTHLPSPGWGVGGSMFKGR